ncbi:hypothetical protein H1R20_g533, partial [Candolleomyces eurysporus]
MSQPPRRDLKTTRCETVLVTANGTIVFTPGSGANSGMIRGPLRAQFQQPARMPPPNDRNVRGGQGALGFVQPPHPRNVEENPVTFATKSAAKIIFPWQEQDDLRQIRVRSNKRNREAGGLGEDEEPVRRLARMSIATGRKAGAAPRQAKVHEAAVKRPAKSYLAPGLSLKKEGESASDTDSEESEMDVDDNRPRHANTQLGTKRVVSKKMPVAKKTQQSPTCFPNPQNQRISRSVSVLRVLHAVQQGKREATHDVSHPSSIYHDRFSLYILFCQRRIDYRDFHLHHPSVNDDREYRKYRKDACYSVCPSARSPYLPAKPDYPGGHEVHYSCRPGGPTLYDLLNTLPMEPFGVLDWAVLDREEEIFESDEVKDEYKVMHALWGRWILLNRTKFIANYRKGVKAFVDDYWKIIHRAAGWDALRYWLLLLLANRFLTANEVAQTLKYYESLTGMDFWYNS